MCAMHMYFDPCMLIISSGCIIRLINIHSCNYACVYMFNDDVIVMSHNDDVIMIVSCRGCGWFLASGSCTGLPKDSIRPAMAIKTR